MSEANNVWRVDVEGAQHEIELEHSSWGQLVVLIDGTEVERKRSWRFTSEYRFDLAGHPARIAITPKYGGFAYQSTLHLDQRYVEPLHR